MEVNFVGNLYKQGPASELTYALQATVPPPFQQYRDMLTRAVRGRPPRKTAVPLRRQLHARRLRPGLNAVRRRRHWPDVRDRLLRRHQHRPGP